MPQRPPDSRATAGQQIEDRLDAITDETRRRTGQWIVQLRRPAPNDIPMLGAIVSGIAGGVLDALWERSGADADAFRQNWAAYAEAYLDAMLEDRENDAEPGSPS